MLENAISNLREGIENTVRRYPVAIVVAIIATILGWYFINIESNYQPKYRADESSCIAFLLSLCSLAMPVVFAAHAMYNGGKKAAGIGVFAGLPVLLWLFSWLIDYELNTEYDFVLYLLWSIAGHFLAAIAAFWHSDEINGFWQWNKQLFLRFLVSGLYSSVLYIGISGAILAIRLLFDWKIPEQVFGYLFVTIGTLFQTTFFLGGLSSPIADLQQETDYPKGLKIFTQYVLLPLMLIYFAILYVYMGKIILQFTLPKGSVCFLVLGFSIVGILSILLLHPLLDDEKEAKWVRTVGKSFYFLLLPLTVLMFISIATRLGDYGVTPNRYIMLLLAVWLFTISLYFIFSKKRNIILIPASLMFIAFFSSFGPWGMIGVSERSQTAILKQLFIDNKLMKNDTLIGFKAPGELAKDTLRKGDGRRVESILRSLKDMNGLTTFKKWIPQSWHKQVFNREDTNFEIRALEDKLNVDFSLEAYQPGTTETINYYSAQCQENDINKPLETYGFKRIWFFHSDDTETYSNELIKLTQNAEMLTFKTNEAEYIVNILPFLENLKKTGKFDIEQSIDLPVKDMIIEGNGFKMLVKSCSFSSDTTAVSLTELSGIFLFNK